MTDDLWEWTDADQAEKDELRNGCAESHNGHSIQWTQVESKRGTPAALWSKPTEGIPAHRHGWCENCDRWFRE